MTIETPDIQSPPSELIESFPAIGSATATGELYKLGIRYPHLEGFSSRISGRTVVSPALTLQFLPKRDDLYNVDEFADPEQQMHRHVLYHNQPGDVVVVDARSDMRSGVFGDMMLTYFKGSAVGSVCSWMDAFATSPRFGS